MACFDVVTCRSTKLTSRKPLQGSRFWTASHCSDGRWEFTLGTGMWRFQGLAMCNLFGQCSTLRHSKRCHIYAVHAKHIATRKRMTAARDTFYADRATFAGGLHKVRLLVKSFNDTTSCPATLPKASKCLLLTTCTASLLRAFAAGGMCCV